MTGRPTLILWCWCTPDLTVIAGSKYEADAVASAMANPNTDTFLNSINPGNTIKVIVLIDVPAGQQLETVELHDSLFSAGTSVSVK